MIGGESSHCGQALPRPLNPTSLTNSSSGETDGSRKEQPVATERPVSGEDIHTQSCNSATSAEEEEQRLVPAAIDERGGVIPRAVSDIFRFVQEELGRSAAADCGGRRLAARQNCGNDAEEVDNKRASTAAAASSGGTCTSGSDFISSCSNPSNSGGSSYSENFDTEEGHSATHWPWKTPNGPTRHDQNEVPRTVLPSSYSGSDARTSANEGGVRRKGHENDKRSAAQSRRWCTVECSYMEVGSGRPVSDESRSISFMNRPATRVDGITVVAAYTQGFVRGGRGSLNLFLV